MDNPMADSAAATTRTYNEKTCPIISSNKTVEIIKQKFRDKSINSMDISNIIRFLRLTTIPKIPMRKSTKARVK